MNEIRVQGSKYTADTRRAACIEYAVKGNAEAVAKSLGIPARTIQDWANQDWWHALTAELRVQTESRIIAEVDGIIERAHRETIDRLDNGDVVLHQGELIRVPMKGKDAATIAAISIDKRQILLNKPTSISGNVGSDAIRALAEQFEELSRRHNEKVVESD